MIKSHCIYLNICVCVCPSVCPSRNAFHYKVALYIKNKSKLCEAQPRERGALDATNA